MSALTVNCGAFSVNRRNHIDSDICLLLWCKVWSIIGASNYTGLIFILKFLVVQNAQPVPEEAAVFREDTIYRHNPITILLSHASRMPLHRNPGCSFYSQAHLRTLTPHFSSRKAFQKMKDSMVSASFQQMASINPSRNSQH